MEAAPGPPEAADFTAPGMVVNFLPSCCTKACCQACGKNFTRTGLLRLVIIVPVTSLDY